MLRENKGLTSVSEGEVISRNLAEVLEVSPPIISTPDPILEQLAKRKLAPTIGCEIELHWSHVLRRTDPELAERLVEVGPQRLYGEQRAKFEAICDDFKRREMPRLKATRKVGIPTGFSRLWEFAFRPSTLHHTQADWIATLYAGQLLVAEVNTYPLHVTVADLPVGRTSGVIGFTLEATGGSDAARLKTGRNKNSWAVKGDLGIHYRTAEHFELIGAQKASEFRTLMARSPEQVRQTVRNAQWLGSLVLLQRAKLLNGDIIQDLSHVAADFGLDCSKRWQSIKNQPLEENWQRYLALFEHPAHELGNSLQNQLDRRIHRVRTLMTP